MKNKALSARTKTQHTQAYVILRRTAVTQLFAK